MRFTIKREEFLKGLLTASRAVTGKASVVPVLSNLKMDLNDLGLFITGSNYDLTIKTFVPYIIDNVEIIRNYSEGSILISSKIITDIARKMESDELTFELVDSTVAVIGDFRSEYKLNCVRSEEYPDLDLDPTGTKVTLNRKEFDSLVNQTCFAASIKEQRPILTAINLEASGDTITATATDSARLAKKTVTFDGQASFVANVPAKMLIEINHLIENETNVSIAISDKKALFTIGRTVVATRLIAGEYPNTKGIVPSITNYSLEINANDLIKAIDRANILSLDRENVVDLSMSEAGISISAKSVQIGSSMEKVDIFKYTGAPLKISFNSEFVISAVKALNCEDVTFLFVGEMRPFIVKNVKDDSVIQLVTPVRAN